MIKISYFLPQVPEEAKAGGNAAKEYDLSRFHPPSDAVVLDREALAATARARAEANIAEGREPLTIVDGRTVRASAVGESEEKKDGELRTSEEVDDAATVAAITQELAVASDGGDDEEVVDRVVLPSDMLPTLYDLKLTQNLDEICSKIANFSSRIAKICEN